MKRVIRIALFLLTLSTSASWAYEPGTHGRLTNAALHQSVLVVPPCNTCTTVLQDLGLTDVTAQQFPDPQVIREKGTLPFPRWAGPTATM